MPKPPMSHWDVDLQMLVPVPDNDKRIRQPAITESPFKLIHALAKRGATTAAIHHATSWSYRTIGEVLAFDTYESFRADREKTASDALAKRIEERQRSERTAVVQAEQAVGEILDTEEPVQEETRPLANFVIDRIVNALEGIDASLKSLKQDSSETLELTRKLYEIWKPANE